MMLLVAILGCQTATDSSSQFNDSETDPSSQEWCDNTIDDDGDGLVDCIDPDCQPSTWCPELCDDGFDNNGDGLTDCQDPSCSDIWECSETQAESCSDGADNDSDGLVDCEDGGCLLHCLESDCTDGTDDDLDQLIDCDDPDCWGLVSCPDSVALFWTGQRLQTDTESNWASWSGSTAQQSGFQKSYVRTWQDTAASGIAWFNQSGETGSCQWFAAELNATYQYSNYNGAFDNRQALSLVAFSTTGGCMPGLLVESFEFQLETLSPLRIEPDYLLTLDGQPFGHADFNLRRPWVQQR